MLSIGTIIQNEYVTFLASLLGSILSAKIVQFIFKKYLHKFTEKTKSDIDDVILKNVTKPLFALIIIIGAYFALTSLTILKNYFTWLNSIFFVLIVFITSLIVSRFLGILVIKGLKVHKKFEKTPKLISKIISLIVYLIAFLMILGHFNLEITPLVATLGLGSLAIGLALQATLSNFFAGLHIISDRPINVGDFVELTDANISGYVEDVGWRSTRIRTLPNQIIIIPNSKLAESIIINDSLPEQEMAALVQVGVSYHSDLKKVEKVTIDVAKNIQHTIQGAVKHFEPFIRYHTFGDSNINFTVILRVEKFVDKYLVTHEFIKALKEQYDKEGIEISWPVRKIYQAK